MQVPLTSVQSAGVAIRALRKRAGIRIDDFALTAGVSKQFMTDLENGKDTVRMGSVLNLLQRLGVRVSLDLPEEALATFQAEFDKVTQRRSRKSASSAQPKEAPSPDAGGVRRRLNGEGVPWLSGTDGVGRGTRLCCRRRGRRLQLFINHDLVGTLHEDNDLWTLVYDKQWADKPGSFDLSPALPRSQLLHRDGATMRPVQWYFDNLLPEEKLRELIAADARLRDKDDAFALLEYLGAESAGSLTLLPPGQVPDAQAQLQPLAYEELSRRISNLPKTTLTREAPKRMSLAGAQHKMLAVLKGEDLYEPVGATPSTHILKPDHPVRETYPASTYLEWLTMRLAAAARLPVPPVQLLHVPEPVYAIERFDRRFDPKAMQPETGQETPGGGAGARHRRMPVAQQVPCL